MTAGIHYLSRTWKWTPMGRGLCHCQSILMEHQKHRAGFRNQNSPMGPASLPLRCRREWNSGLGIGWMGLECSLPPPKCCLEVLWRTGRKSSVNRHLSTRLTDTKCNPRSRPKTPPLSLELCAFRELFCDEVSSSVCTYRWSTRDRDQEQPRTRKRRAKKKRACCCAQMFKIKTD